MVGIIPCGMMVSMYLMGMVILGICNGHRLVVREGDANNFCRYFYHFVDGKWKMMS